MQFSLRIALCLALTFCGASAAEPNNSQKVAYKPVFAASMAKKGKQGESDLQKQFRHALSAGTVAQARQRWEAFLKKYQPANGEYGDNFQKMHVDSARYELMRAYYLSGMREKGDKLLLELNPLELSTTQP